jgi:hypothetical protein
VLVLVVEVPLVPVVEVVLVEVVEVVTRIVVVVVIVVVLVVVGGGSVQGENSDVLPSGAMAVAVITMPAGTSSFSVTVKLASPLASVVTSAFAPTNRAPSPLPDESQASFEKISTRKVVLGVESSVPEMEVPPGKRMASSVG